MQFGHFHVMVMMVLGHAALLAGRAGSPADTPQAGPGLKNIYRERRGLSDEINRGCAFPRAARPVL